MRSLAFVLIIAFVGCAHIYDEGRHNLTLSTQETVAKLDLSDTFKSIGDAYAVLADERLSEARLAAALNFDSELRLSVTRGIFAEGPRVSDTGPGGLIRARLKALLGEESLSPGILRKFEKIDVELLQKKSDQYPLLRLELLADTGRDIATCQQVSAVKADSQIAVSPYFLELQDNCLQQETLKGELTSIATDSSIVKLLSSDPSPIATAAYDAEKKLKQAEAAFVEAKSEIAANDNRSTRLGKLEAAATKLTESLQNFEKEHGEDLSLSEERLAAIYNVLGAIGTGEAADNAEVSASTLRSIAYVRSIASIADDVNLQESRINSIRATPLVAAAAAESLRVQRLRDVRDLVNRQRQLRQERLDSAVREALHLAAALRLLESKVGAETLKKLSELKAGKSVAIRALGHYAGPARAERLQQVELETRTALINQELRLIDSIHAAMQWQTVLDLTSDVLMSYEEVGIRPERAAAFWHSLGLFGVAIGAAQ